MIKGIIERRTANRIPFKTALKIKFITPDVQTSFTANTIDISAGGLKFSTAEKIPGIEIGETLEFVFDLPGLGQTSVIAEITYYDKPNASQNYPRQICYGVKFLEMSLDTWNNVVKHSGMAYLTETDESISSDKATISVENEETIIEKSHLSIILQFQDGTEAQAQLEDISFGGIRVNTARSISVNSQVALNIRYQEHLYHLTGVCVWNIADTAGGYAAGIFFDELTKDQFSDLKILIHQLHH